MSNTCACNPARGKLCPTAMTLWDGATALYKNAFRLSQCTAPNDPRVREAWRAYDAARFLYRTHMFRTIHPKRADAAFELLIKDAAYQACAE